ncbi:hypothetical protein BH10ACI3_BH10ACI3_28710 [soil metagenome]
MAHLSVVKSLSQLREEQKYSDEVLVGSAGIAIERGSVTEIAGGPSSGKTSLSLALLAKLTAAGEICAVVDACDSFDPSTAALAGVQLEGLLWIKCSSRLEKAFMAADYLVQAKGFGCVWLNLAGLPERLVKMVPKTYWYRYRTRIRETPTILLVTAEEHVTGPASQQSLVFTRERTVWSGSGRFKLLREFHLKMHSRKGFYGEAMRTRIGMDYSEV